MPPRGRWRRAGAGAGVRHAIAPAVGAMDAAPDVAAVRVHQALRVATAGGTEAARQAGPNTASSPSTHIASMVAAM